MPKAATYKGSCQCCGRWHKLPASVLAKHGYQVQWGHFNGVCPGSGELPFEESCALIERFIANAEEHCAKLEEFRATLLQPATAPRAWYHEYISWTRNSKSTYMWREVDLSEDADGVIWYTNSKGKLERLDTYRYGKSLLQVATMLNERRAQALAKEIQKVAEYIAWQKGRIANWQPGELRPLE